MRTALVYDGEQSPEIEEDVYGKPCGKAKDSLKLQAGERTRFRRAFEQDKPGWYAVKATLVAAPAAAWTIDTKPLHGTGTAAGKTYTVKDVTDGERGAVLELTRGDDNKGKTIGGIRLKKPVIVPEDATTIGVWVKGNSSRGWTRDWGEKLRLDFDG